MTGNVEQLKKNKMLDGVRKSGLQPTVLHTMRTARHHHDIALGASFHKYTTTIIYKHTHTNTHTHTHTHTHILTLYTAWLCNQPLDNA